ncbi:hypothetical protein QE430_002471 [Microbacterium testaceum]|uniref:hypothetical protein n=1 Tax=Microbacterium testaceum TaxID=2033 RepID=UPI002787B627|nr:hypothetical protein [Microbacterium testaceum]MDQ1174164.1 hypothetical protein [Microbacterium testaceum]
MDDIELDWVLTVNDARTGTFIAYVDSSASTWSTGIAPDGTSTETIKTDDAETPWGPGELAALFDPNDRLLVRWWGDVPVYAHKIEEFDYSRDEATVKLTACELLREADWRLVGQADADKYVTLTITNRSPSGAIRAALERMQFWSVDWKYPIDLPADGAGDITDKWPFWKKNRISDIIKQIEDRAGVETYLRPYRTTGRDIRFETIVAKRITVGATYFDLDAEDLPLSGVHYKVDAKRQVTGIVGVGNGTGEDQETRWAGRGNFHIPIRDVTESFPDLTGDALQKAVDNYYAVNIFPITQWSIGEFILSNGHTITEALPARRWEVKSKGDPVIPDGIHALRVIKISGDNSRTVKTEVQGAAA